MSTAADVLAYLGGVFLAVCLIPQIHIMWLHHSAEDVSLSWTLFFITGLCLTFIYLVMVNAFAGWISIVPEIFLAFVLLFSKLYLDAVNAKTKAPALKEVDIELALSLSQHSKKEEKQTEDTPCTSTEDSNPSSQRDSYRPIPNNESSATSVITIDYSHLTIADSNEFLNWFHRITFHTLNIQGIPSPYVSYDAKNISEQGLHFILDCQSFRVVGWSVNSTKTLTFQVTYESSEEELTKKVIRVLHESILSSYPGTQSKMSYSVSKSFSL